LINRVGNTKETSKLRNRIALNAEKLLEIEANNGEMLAMSENHKINLAKRNLHATTAFDYRN